MSKILIDGDSCNTINKIVEKARRKNKSVHIYCDTQHYLQNDYATVHIIDEGPDAADFAIMNNTRRGDIIYTNDGGLAAMVMAKGGIAKRFNGHEYTDIDVSNALLHRYIRNVTYKHTKSKNVSSRHGKTKKKTIYIKECWI